jgi:hypothetical protein
MADDQANGQRGGFGGPLVSEGRRDWELQIQNHIGFNKLPVCLGT